MSCVRWSALLVLIVAVGCTLGPEPVRPETAADEVPAFAHADGAAAVSLPSEPWWRGFGDPVTAGLVELALEQNADLRAAAARVLEADAALRRAGGARWPQMEAGASATRQKSSFVLPEVGRISPLSTTYADDVRVSYLVDLFGRLERTRQSAWASLLAEEAAAELVQHAVVVGVVRARVQVATLEGALEVSRRIRSSWEETLETVERRYRSGLVQAVDVYLARENLSSARAGEVQVTAQLAQARHALDVLVGRRPASGEDLPRTLDELPDLAPVPTGLPADLLDRRPDLRQAELRLAAATYGIGIALADLFPTLSLTATAGVRSDTLSDLANSQAVVYTAVANLVAPLFTGGQRRADVEAARARAEEAAALYAGAVLTALREVEDALVRDASSRERLELTRQRVAQARSADRLARDRYQRGVEELLRVLETERRLRAAEEALITARADVWNARIDLFLALGGDWTPEPAPLSDDATTTASSRAGDEQSSAALLSSDAPASPAPSTVRGRPSTSHGSPSTSRMVGGASPVSHLPSLFPNEVS